MWVITRDLACILEHSEEILPTNTSKNFLHKCNIQQDLGHVFSAKKCKNMGIIKVSFFFFFPLKSPTSNFHSFSAI